MFDGRGVTYKEGKRTEEEEEEEEKSGFFLSC